MATQVEQISQYISTIEIDGSRFLAVQIAESSGRRSTKQFVEDGLQPGYLVSGNVIDTWKPLGLKEIDGIIYLYGPYAEGRTIEAILDHEPQSALEFATRLGRVYALLSERSLELPPVQTNGILFLEDGGVLILPPKILERLRSVQIEEARFQTYEMFNHPDLEGERSVTFSLGVILYRVVTGAFPFSSEDEVELHSQMRSLQVTPPNYKSTTLNPVLSDGIMQALDSGSTDITIGELYARLGDVVREGMHFTISEEEQTRLRTDGERIETRSRSAYRRRRYLERNGRRIAFIGIGAAVFIAVATSMIINLTKPRVTLGMGPSEVVELFYTSITALDHAGVEDSVAKRVARAEINEAINLYVVTRTRVANEGSSGLVDPADWNSAGRPALDEGISLYGVDRLEIKLIESRVPRSETEQQMFEVTYNKWEMDLSEDLTYLIRGANAKVSSRRDIVALAFDGTYWMITEIERIEDELLLPSDPDRF